MKIMLLEDDYSLSQSIKESLELKSYDVDCFYDGLEAFEHISTKYDLYILDVCTPTLEGIDVLSKIKHYFPNSNVIMISAMSDINKIREAYSNGCDDYIKKPFEIEELIFKTDRINDKNSICILSENIKYCKKSKELYIDNTICNLTKNEKNLLALFIEKINRPVKYSEIEDMVYNGATKSTDSIKSLVKRLRKKLPDNIIHNTIEEGYSIIPK